MATDNLRLQVILDGIDKVSRPLKAVRDNSTALTKALKDARAEQRQLQNALGDIQKYKAMGNASQQMADNVNAARQKFRELESQLHATENPSKNLQNEFRAARRELVALERNQQRHNSTLREAQQRMSAAGLDARNMAAREIELASSLASVTQRVSEQTRQLETLRERQQWVAQHRADMTGAMMRGAAGFGMVQAASGTLQNTLMPSVKAFADLEDAKAQLKVSMLDKTGSVGPEFEKIAELATRLGDRLPGTTADFMSMMTMLKKQGMSSTAILGGLGEAAAYIGVQLKLPAEQAAEFAAKMQDATRTTESDMMGLMDTIQRMSGIGVETDNMLEAFKSLSPAMDMVKRQGLDGARAFAPFIVMMDQAGMRGESAGNAIRKVVQASLNVDKIKKTTDGTGVKLDFTNGKGEFGGIEKMMSELQKLKKLNTVKRLEIMKGIFGDDSETLQVLAKIIDQGKGGYDEVVRKMEAQADLQARVNEQLSTLAALWEAASGTFTNMLAVFGEAISPELKSLTRWFGDMSASIGAFSKENPELVRAVASIIAGIAGLTAAAGTWMMASAAFSGAMAVLKFGALKFLGALGSLFSGLFKVARAIAFVGNLMMANPILLAVALMAGAAYLLWKNWDGVVGGLKAIWENLGGSVTAVISTITATLVNFSPLDIMYAGFSALLNYFGIELPATLSAAGSKLIQSLIDGMKSMLPNLGGVMDWVKEKIGWHKEGGAGLANGIKQLGAGVVMGAATVPLAAGVPIDNRGPLVVPAAKAAQQQAAPVTVNVHPSPGMNEQQLAQEVAKQLAATKQREAAQARSRLRDKE